MQRTSYLAARRGSALVDAILSTLRRSTKASAPGSSKLTLLVGHDTNLANIGGMLGLHWSSPSYLPDDTPPASALHFELLRDRQTGDHAVRITYVAQTLDQMRGVSLLDRANPPERTTAMIDLCAGSDEGVCPWSVFTALANRAVDRACVGLGGAKPGG